MIALLLFATLQVPAPSPETISALCPTQWTVERIDSRHGNVWFYSCPNGVTLTIPVGTKRAGVTGTTKGQPQAKLEALDATIGGILMTTIQAIDEIRSLMNQTSVTCDPQTILQIMIKLGTWNVDHDRISPTGLWVAIRADLASRANEVARLSRNGGAPVLSADSGVETVAAWLQWCDPNGCHTAELAAVEGFDPYDDVTAWETVAGILENA